MSIAAKVAQLIVCETCGSAQPDEHGRSRGERLFACLSALAETTPQIALSRTRCLWSCSRSCAVHLRSAGRVGYVLGDLEPSEDYARALLAYAERYADSPEGAVPYKTWPALLRGHFICRLPVVEG